MLGKWVSYYWLFFYDLIVFYWTWPKDSEPKKTFISKRQKENDAAILYWHENQNQNIQTK